MATRRTPAQYNWDTVEFDETPITEISGYPDRTSPRIGNSIRFIVVHHMAMVGNGSGSAADACIRTWRTRKASAHYCVDGKNVRQTVWDRDAAWATGGPDGPDSDGQSDGNQYGISIEHANSTAGPKWQVSADTFKTGARLVAYLHKAYGLGRPVSGKTLRQHDEFTGTACPGPYLGGTDWPEYVAEAQRVYDQITKPAPPPPPAPTLYPAAVLGKHFQKVTLPVDGPDSGRWADEITPPRILTYTSEYLRVASDGKSVIFKCFHGGATTSGSKNPRTEGRETNVDGSLAEWDGRKNLHGIRATFSINQLTPVKPEVVLLQVHNGADDVATIRAEGVHDSAGKLTNRVKLYGTRGNESNYAYLGEVVLTQRFTVSIDIKGGRVRFVLNGKQHAKTVAATADCYLKLGLYLQSNPETAPKEKYGAAALVRLFEEPEVWHRAA